MGIACLASRSNFSWLNQSATLHEFVSNVILRLVSLGEGVIAPFLKYVGFNHDISSH